MEDSLLKKAQEFTTSLQWSSKNYLLTQQWNQFKKARAGMAQRIVELEAYTSSQKEQITNEVRQKEKEIKESYAYQQLRMLDQEQDKQRVAEQSGAQ